MPAPRMKDIILSMIGSWVANSFVRKYGKVSSIKLDTEQKNLTVTAELLGELSPLTIVLKYKSYRRNGQMLVEITYVESSREWIKLVANDYLNTNKAPIEVPGGLAAAAFRFLGI